MSGWTRLTVHGTARRAQVVLPDDEPVAGLLPPLLDLLGEERAAGARPVTLVTLLGEQVDPGRSLAEQDVMQGSLLRLVRVDQAPPPPEVADVTDLVAAQLAERGDRWQPQWSLALATMLAGAAGWLAARAAVASPIDAAVLIAIVAGAAVLAAAIGRVRAQPGTALGAAAAGAWVAVAPSMAGRLDVAVPGAAVLVGVLGAGLIVAVVAGAGLRRVPVAIGALLGALLAGAALALAPLIGVPGAVGSIAVGCVLVLGLLPGVAMTVSGLNGLDDRAVSGDRPARDRVVLAVQDTYRALTSSTISVCGVAAVTGWALVVQDGALSALLGGVVAALVALRARVLPLAPQRLAVWASATAIGLGWAITRMQDAPLLVAGAAGGAVLVAVLAVTIRPSGPVRAQARRVASVVELLGVVATVPLLLAQLGVFSDLLGTF
ncbi:EsaB/YukD family protein [Cellulomonas cellasea]|uniref:EsaB/YukD family protein n=1 Tax=Cellulomonas cellasea TaxID=43670 RepID=UPI0025A45260|nr:EsaB/YukD family protein [Cellulomonas cellasea]MDM8084213.1 EsaB/YukD family protein [Cellulomonas cellasea]